MNDEAVEFIREGIEKGLEITQEHLYPYPILMTNPFYDNLRDDPRFQEILKEQKDKYEERLKKYGEFEIK
jgi:hypothetical protein